MVEKWTEPWRPKEYQAVQNLCNLSAIGEKKEIKGQEKIFEFILYKNSPNLVGGGEKKKS